MKPQHSLWAALAAVTVLAVGCQDSEGRGVVRADDPANSRDLSSDPNGASSPASAPEPGKTDATPNVAQPEGRGAVTERRTDPTTPAGASTSEDSTVLLALAFKEGESFKFVNSMTGTTESTMPSGMGGQTKDAAKPRTSKITMSSESTFKVAAVENGVASINMKTSNVKVNADANDPAATMVQNMTKAAEGREVTLKYSQNGRMADDKASVNMMQMSDSLANFFGFMGLTFPDGPAKIGDTWKSEIDLAKMTAGAGASGMNWTNAKLPAQYTLRAIDRKAGTATIEFTVQGAPVMVIRMPEPPKDAEGKSKAPANMPREMKMTMELKVTGKSVVDIATGLPRESTSTSNVTTSSPMMGTMKQNLTTTTKRA
ncbi:MAG: hypothetical protein KF884_04290 [Fimbriimonadaceae bacterium]|nr:hypothetical protein [Fimbriimonadaceae bacterium]QYK59309.1 MAG: hypothetical protein KF884_04290 [Fimbriimonadaceae bacterium]